jgi:hypothetical protein
MPEAVIEVETSATDTAVIELESNESTDAVAAINAIRASARAEFQNENEHLRKQIELLSEQIDSLSQRLEPLVKFESVLRRNIKSPLHINIYDLSAEQQQLLLAIAEEHYPETSKKAMSGKDMLPINRMFSDLTMKLVESGYRNCWLQHLIIGNQFVVRDGV